MHFAVARCLELEAASASLENDLQTELKSLRESSNTMSNKLKERQAELSGALEQLASAETTVQEWESK